MLLGRCITVPYNKQQLTLEVCINRAENQFFLFRDIPRRIDGVKIQIIWSEKSHAPVIIRKWDQESATCKSTSVDIMSR